MRELIVVGVPVSLQGSRRGRAAWQVQVAEQAREAVPEDQRLEYGTYTDLAVSVAYFHFGEMIGDLDNIVKPILDALTGPLWSNDRMIASLRVRRIQLDADRSPIVRNPTERVRGALERALETGRDFVYVTAAADDWTGEL